MRPADLFRFAYVLAFAGDVVAQTPTSSITYPSYVVDAQIPIVSSDGFSSPQGLATVAGGTVYVADNGDHRVLKFAADGSQTAVSFGTLRPAVSTPGGVAFDGFGNLYVTDTATNRLIKLTAGSANGLAVMGAPILDRPVAVAADAEGNLAIVNAGDAKVVGRRNGGTAVLFNTGSTVLVAPTAVAFDNQGMLYVADAGNGTTAPAVYRFPKLGGTGVAVGPTGYALKEVTGLALDDQRNLFVLDGADRQLIEVPVSGGSAFLIPQSNFKSPSGLALDNLGNIYVSDSGASNTVTKFVYNNAANFGSVQVGATSNAITFNYEFYERTIVEATRGIGGGVWNAEYHKALGGTCTLRTYYPSISSTGLTLPASCTVMLDFQPTYPGGRPGAVQLQTSNGNETQLTVGMGLGAQLALFNAPITTKLGSINYPAPMVINYADTVIYFCGPGGTYRVPVGGGTPTLVTTKVGMSLALNGAGDVFIFSPPTITKIPADGSASTTINVPGLINPQAMAMDSNGAFYISDTGPTPTYSNGYALAAFILRVSPAGHTIVIASGSGYSVPGFMTSDGQGNVYIADGGLEVVFEVAGWTGSYTEMYTDFPKLTGYNGANIANLAIDASGTFYYWDSSVDFFQGPAYTPVVNQFGPSAGGLNTEYQLPLYTIPPIMNESEDGTILPFFSATGNQTMMTSASGKLYVTNGAGPGVFVIDRTQGYIPAPAFNPNVPFIGNKTQGFYVYNVGNQNATFTSATQTFTESGNGVGSFTFSTPTGGPTPCVPGTVIPPSGYCAIFVTNVNAPGSGPIVTDSLHFLTDALNNNSVSFNISGTGSLAP